MRWRVAEVPWPFRVLVSVCDLMRLRSRSIAEWTQREGLACCGGVGRGRPEGHIRRGSQVTVLVRRDLKWLSVTGPAELIGPDDLGDGVDHDAVRLLLRDVFRAAGGTHDDWDEYDRTMVNDACLAVFVAPNEPPPLSVRCGRKHARGDDEWGVHVPHSAPRSNIVTGAGRPPRLT